MTILISENSLAGFSRRRPPDGPYERLGFTALVAPERFMEIADPDVNRGQ